MKTHLRLPGLVPLTTTSMRTTQKNGLILLRQLPRRPLSTHARPFGSFCSTSSSPSSPRPSSNRPVVCAPWSRRLAAAKRGECVGGGWMGFATSGLRRGKERGEELEGVAPGLGGKLAYPERLLIYHAGTGRTTFLACLKVTTLFMFGFFDMIVTPMYLVAGESLAMTAGIALCGLIPPIFVTTTTTPFVASIHLRLPPYARTSHSILERFVRTGPPRHIQLDVTTVSIIGKPRVSSLLLSDLTPVKKGGLVSMVANFERDVTRVEEGRKWWRWSPVKRFNVIEGGEVGVKEGWVWGALREGVERRARLAGAGKA